VFYVYTRWRSTEDFDAWLNSPAFQHGHRQHSTQGPVGTGSDVLAFDVVQEERA
jgi:heme-degrading monooxygenase HmoA